MGMKIAVAVMRYATKEGVFGPSPLAVVCSGWLQPDRWRQNSILL